MSQGHTARPVSGTQASPHALPRGLLGMLGLVLVVEAAFAQHALDLTRFYTYDWVVTGRAAQRRAAGCDVLCFGDSLVKFGVAPRVLAGRLGCRAYSLAVCGGQAPSSYFLLRRALDSGARPQAVVVDFMPHLLDHGPRQNLRQWPELVSAPELLDLALTAHNASFLGSLVLGRALPSVKDRYELRENLLALCRGKTVHTRADMPAFVRNWEINLGAQLSPCADTSRKVYNLARWEDFTRPWACNAVNAAYVRRFLALAAERHITVFWLLPPTRSDVQARRERLGIDARYESFVRSLQHEFPNVVVVDGRHSGFEAQEFLDPLHLNGRGALALSAGLADVLASCLAAGPAQRRGWVRLPAPASDRMAVVFEDLDQSRTVLNRLNGGRKTE